MDSIPQEKICTKCGQSKPLDDFYKHPLGRYGRQPDCKACNKAGVKRRRAEDPERYKAYAHELYLRNAEVVKERGKRNYRDNLEQRRAQRKEYRVRNKDRVREIQKAWQRRRPDLRAIYRTRLLERDPDYFRKAYRRWYARNHEKARAAYRRWEQANREKVVAKTRRRAEAPGAHTLEEWQALCARYDHCCLACGERKPLTVDHIVPISKGGSSDIENIQPLCKSCNSSKGTKDIDYRC